MSLATQQASDELSYLRALAQKTPLNIGFPESEDIRIVRVAYELLAEKSVASISLFTPKNKFLSLATEHGISFEMHQDRIHWISCEDLDRGFRLTLAAQMLKNGKIDCAIAGNEATTAEVIRVGIKEIGLAEGVRTVSGAFIMNRKESSFFSSKTFLFADSGVCIAPNLEQLVDIGFESVKTWNCVFPHISPVVAYLSFSTKGSAVHDSAVIMRQAASQLQTRLPHIMIDGELQFDAAVDQEIAARKAPESRVAGKANIFIFPDLNSGNISYKIAQRLGGFEAYGPILQGLAKPFSDLSRGSSEADIKASAYINLIRAMASKRLV